MAEISSQTANSAPPTVPVGCVPICVQILSDLQATRGYDAMAFRMNLRVWFGAAIVLTEADRDQAWHGSLSEQNECYQMLDELLSLCVLENLNPEHTHYQDNDRHFNYHDLNELLDDRFSDPAKVMEYRRMVRCWFVSNVGTYEENLGGSTLPVQAELYEELDELLTSLVIQRLPGATPFTI